MPASLLGEGRRLNKYFKAFVIAMIALAALGAALLVQGAVRHVNRPLAPTAPGGSVRYVPASSEAGHV